MELLSSLYHKTENNASFSPALFCKYFLKVCRYCFMTFCRAMTQRRNRMQISTIRQEISDSSC